MILYGFLPSYVVRESLDFAHPKPPKPVKIRSLLLFTSVYKRVGVYVYR